MQCAIPVCRLRPAAVSTTQQGRVLLVCLTVVDSGRAADISATHSTYQRVDLTAHTGVSAGHQRGLANPQGLWVCPGQDKLARGTLWGSHAVALGPSAKLYGW